MIKSLLCVRTSNDMSPSEFPSAERGPTPAAANETTAGGVGPKPTASQRLQLGKTIARYCRALVSLRRRCPPWLVRDVLVPLTVSRVAFVLVAWLGFHLLQIPLKNTKWEVASDGNVHNIRDHLSTDVYPFVNMWARWDSGWYLDIAKHGYNPIPGEQPNVAFFPLYPSLLRVVHDVVPLRNDAGWFSIGIILSNAALLIALIYFYRLITLDYGRPVAARAVLYLCVFPTTLFLSAVYSESLFLALVVTTFYYARTTRWFVSGALAAAGALCRPLGVLLIIPLAVEYLSQKEFQWRQIKADCLVLILAPLALAGHLTFLRWRFGGWDAISQAETMEGWNRHLTAPWNTLWYSIIHINSSKGYHGAVELFFAIVLLALTIFACYRLRPSYAAYAAASLLFITSWGTLISTPRFALVVFPAVMGLALLGGNKAFNHAYLIFSSILACVSMVVFSQWGWVA